MTEDDFKAAIKEAYEDGWSDGLARDADSTIVINDDHLDIDWGLSCTRRLGLPAEK